MSRTAKWLFVAVGVLFLIAVIAIFVILTRLDFNVLKPQAAKAVQEATGRNLEMEGDVKLKLGFSPILSVENVSFENAPWGSRPNMANVKRLEVQVALLPLLRRDIEIKRLILVEPDILIETNKEGKTNLSFEKSAEEEAPAERKPAEGVPGKGKMELPALTFDRVRVEDAKLTYRDGKTGKTQTATLALLTASAPEKDGPIAIAAKGTYDQQPFAIDGTVGPIAAITDPARPWPLKLKAEALGTTANLDGSIKDVPNTKGIDINITAEGQSLGQMLAFAGVKDVPEQGPFSLAAKVTDPAEKTYKLSDLKVNLKDSDIAGMVEVALAGKRPRISADLSSQKIDLRPLMEKKEAAAPSGAPKQSAEPKPKKDKVFPAEELPLDVMKRLDAKVTMKAKKLLLPQLAINDATADVALQNGVLNVRPFSASAGGGTLNGNVQLAAAEKPADLTVAMKVERLEVGKMLAEVGVTDKLEGVLDADVQLSGRGQSVAELMANLNGKTVTMMDGGRINNEYLALLSQNLGPGLFTLLNPGAEKEKYTNINCFVNRFDIKNGIADTTVLLADTSPMTVAGGGTIDLQTEKLNISLVPTPKKGILGEASAKAGMNLGELATPFKLSGTFANPKLAVDPQQSIAVVGKVASIIEALRGGDKETAAADTQPAQPTEDPCTAAKKIAETGQAPPAAKTPEEKGVTEQLPAEVPEDVKGAIGEAEKQLKKFFGE